MKLKRKLYSNSIISGRELKFNTYDPLGDRSIIKFKSNKNPEPEEIAEEEEIENKEDLNLPENEELEENYNNQIEDDEFDDDNEYKNYE